MKNKRLAKIAAMVPTDSSVVDIGCDHGYLAIYLKQEKKCPRVIASDINENALSMAKKNIKNAKLSRKIPCVLSNGLEKIPIEQVDTAIIAGMGTHTILKILEHPKAEKIKTFILQSNNDYELLRSKMEEKGYRILEEGYIEEKGHDYFIIKYQKGTQKLTKQEKKYGLYSEQNHSYYQKLIKRQEKIIKQIPWHHWHHKKDRKKELREIKLYSKGMVK